LKLNSAQSDYYRGQINFVRRIAYRYCDTYTGDQGVTPGDCKHVRVIILGKYFFVY